MTFSLGWHKRGEDGERLNIEFALVRQKAAWKVQHARYEPREDYQPTDEDWDTLFETMDRHLARGKVSHTDYKIVRRIRRDGK